MDISRWDLSRLISCSVMAISHADVVKASLTLHEDLAPAKDVQKHNSSASMHGSTKSAEEPQRKSDHQMLLLPQKTAIRHQTILTQLQLQM
jgi:hypothetical protein